MKPLRIAISGAHRTGKSKLCKELAAILGLTYLESIVTSVIRSSGFATDGNLRYPNRMKVQLELADAYDALFAKNPAFITDRCHFDFLLYSYMEVGNDFPTDKSLEYVFEDYIERLVKESKNLDVLYLLQPGIPIIQADGKGSTVRPLLDKLNLLALGLIEQHGIPCTIIPKDCIDFNSRVAFVTDDLKKRQFL